MYKCADCSDTGLITDIINDKGYVRPCFCDLKRVKSNLFGAYFADKTIDNYEGRTPSMQEAKKIIKKNPLSSFFIHGNVGLGKTHLLAGIYELLYQDLRYLKTSVTTETALIHEIQLHKFYDLRDRDEIIIDDVGKISMQKWESQTLFDFYNDIYRRRMQIVISSNYSLPEIAEIYGGAITRRIEERCEILHIKGE